MNRRTLSWGLLLASTLAAYGLSIAYGPGEPADSAALGGADRYLTFLSTDKQVYRVGETVYGRAVLLHALTRSPLPDTSATQALFEVRGPKGDVVASMTAASQQSVIGLAWQVPDGQAGGEYTLKVTYPWTGYAPAERRFDVRAYRAPRLKSQIVFLRDGYGPGDKVTATLHTERAEGGAPAGAKVAAIARVDGVEVFRGDTAVDAAGNAYVQFDLPAEIARGEGSLALVIEDGGVSETAAKTVPILVQTVDLQVYPESGDLVDGLATRVYLEARTPARKPADVAGIVIDEEGDAIATFRTEHEGRGRFEFTPRKGGTYTLKVMEPAGIKVTFGLMPVKDSGGIIRTTADVYRRGEPVRLRVLSSFDGELSLSLRKREVEVATARVQSLAGAAADVTLTPPDTADGVLIATLWRTLKSDGGQVLGREPVAERLIFREPARNVTVRVAASKADYVPGEPVELTIHTTDDAGQPISAVVGVTVSDDSVRELIEKREQPPALPVMVLLEPEVHELADAHVYLNPDEPKGPIATDLLLGTQGWRRYALLHVDEFLKRNGDAARRALAQMAPTVWTRTAGFGGGERLELLDTVFRMNAPAGEARGKPADGAEIRLGMPLLPAPNENAAPLAARAERATGTGPDAAPRLEDVAEADRRQNEEAGASRVAGRDDQNRARELVARLDKKADFRFVRRISADEFEAGRLLAPAVWVREYAHKARADRQAGDRVDFTETLYWNAGVRTDEMGVAKVSFDLSDAVTAFRAAADAFDARGGLGETVAKIESVQPFYIEPKLPLEVTTGDQVLMPLSLVSRASIDDGQLTIRGPDEIRFGGEREFSIGADGRVRRLIPLDIGFAQPGDVVVAAHAGGYRDTVTRPLSVRPAGFPVEVAFGGLIGPDGGVSHTVEIPPRVALRSVSATATVFPTPLANLTEALQRLLQEPNGCFEQTSSTSYPLTMAQQYFLSHTGVDPRLISDARDRLERGYQRLVSFECKSKGYEWFGGDPGHEALTAFGLLHFEDMSKVRPVDADMLARTRAWLLGTRDGQGGFTRKQRALHTWIEDRECSNGYILWALLESGVRQLGPEVAWLKQAARGTKNSYVIALAANAMALSGDHEEARRLMQRLAALQDKTGMVSGGTATIVGSGGDALNIETTSLAVLAWLRDPAFTAAVENGIRYLAERCKAGRFASTQSTVLALRAIVKYDELRARPKAAGKLAVFVDGQSIGGPVAFDATTQGAIRLPEMSELLTPGKHTIELRMEAGSSMPYSVAVRYHDALPPSSSECKLALTASLRSGQVREGELTEATVKVGNRTGESLPTPVAIVGLPGGLEPRHDQLKELVKSGQIDAYEVMGREVVLYWRGMRPNEQRELSLSLLAAIPGTYTGPASRAYLYYSDEFKTWIEPLKVTIAAR